MERYDLLEWINWVNRQPFVGLPIYLFGLSMGAATVLMTAGEALPDNVHGIIADSGYTSPRDEWKYVAEHNLHYHYKWMEKYVDKLSKERLGYLSKSFSSGRILTDKISDERICQSAVCLPNDIDVFCFNTCCRYLPNVFCNQVQFLIEGRESFC